MQSIVRIKKEYKEVQKAKEAGVCAELVGNDWTHWTGSIAGPEGGPYEGGVFLVDIVIPKNYPFVPPKMRFTSKVWHPNVSSANGAICLDILKDEWSPALTLRTALLSLQALLSCPVPEDPQDAQVAKQYINDHEAFVSTATYWTKVYAQPPGAEGEGDAEKVKQMVDMGFAEDDCRAVLRKHNGDANAALNELLSR